MSELPMSLSGQGYGEGTYGAAGYGTDIQEISHQHIRYVMTNDTINTHPDTLAARQNINNLPENGTDFVAEGCDLTLDGDELTVSRGVLVLSHDETLYRVTVGERSGDDVLDVPADSQLGVYYDLAPNEVVVQASAPAEPALQIGSVDTAAGTTTLTNRRPDQTVGSLKADEQTIGSSNTVSGGPLADSGDVQIVSTFISTASGGTFSTNSTSFVEATKNPTGFWHPSALKNGSLKMRFSGDVDQEPADVKYGLANQNAEFNSSLSDGQTVSETVTGYVGRQPDATDWVDIPEDALGKPTVQVKQPDGKDVFVRNLMIQFGYEVV